MLAILRCGSRRKKGKKVWKKIKAVPSHVAYRTVLFSDSSVTGQSCWTMDTWPVRRMVCLFTSQAYDG